MPNIETETEGREADILSFDEVGAIAAELALIESREDPEVEAFTAFFNTLGAQHFSASEMLFMGGGHYGNGACRGKNSVPEEATWDNLRRLVPTLDAIRAELGHPIRLTSIYRSEAYNSCIGGAERSQHRLCTAADCVVSAVGPAEMHAAAMAVRERGDFQGGIGLYGGFVHVDVRGANVNWTG